MDELLSFILKFGSDLYNKYGFHFVDSRVFDSFGNAFIILENKNIHLRFIKDRDQLFLDFHSIFDKKESWYSFDLVRKLITGENEYYSLLNENNGHFLKNNMEKILDLFDEKIVSRTIEELSILRKKRAKVLF